MDLISVIISNYNYEKYIADAIESVLKQSYENYEIIIIDDGSTDNSVEVIEKYKIKFPNKIKAIFQENQGQAAAFNNAFKLCKGRIIAFLDADDYWYENKLEKISQLHKKYSAVQHNLKVNDEYYYTFLDDDVEKQTKALEEYGYTGPIPTSALSFRKDKIEMFFPMDSEGFKVCADLHLKVLFLNEYDIYSTNEALGVYRAHGENNWFYNADKYKDYEELIFKQINHLRKEQGKSKLEPLTQNSYMKYFLDNTKIPLQSNIYIYGTGKLGLYYFEKLKDMHNIKGFASGMISDVQTFHNYKCYSIKVLKEKIESNDYILIASEKMGEIVRDLEKFNIPVEKIITAKL